MSGPRIEPIGLDRFHEIWPVIEAVVRGGDTYALPADLTEEAARAIWSEPGRRLYVARDETGAVVGTYYLRPNQAGGGAHVANCGYMTSPESRGRGVARAMCLHSLAEAKVAGVRAMQFNFVVSTNEAAVALWKRLGFEMVGVLPGAFMHPTHGYVDALVMFRAL
jgi:RimJ/RimL family protein N-acetyltransferase